MDRADVVRLRERQEVVVALQVVAVVVQAAGRHAAEGALVEPELLDHRAHRAVEDQDAAVEQAGEVFGAVGLHGRCVACKSMNVNRKRCGGPRDAAPYA